MSFKSDFNNADGWNAVDTNRKLRLNGGDAFMKFLKAQKVHTVIRYYASSERAKTIDRKEAKLIAENGFAILPVYQDRNQKAEDFSESKGRAAARNALKFVKRLDQPDGSTILFAVDHDLSRNVIDNNVSDYFAGIKREFADQGRRFRIGVYGSGLACSMLMEKGLAEVPWLSMSRLFTGTRKFFESNQWMMRQIPPDTKHDSGFSFDRNLIRVAQEDIGAFTYDEDNNGVIVGSRGSNVGGGTMPPPRPRRQPHPRGGPLFPGDTVSENSGHASEVVKAIQRRLNEVGYGPITVDGDFGSTTTNVVKDFQAENDDAQGVALEVDGEVGEKTWESLFFSDEVDAQIPDVSHFDDTAAAFVQVCLSQQGVQEDKPFKNRGPRVDGYIRATGLEPFAGDFPWCVCFIYWCALKLCEQRNIENPLPRTAGVHRLWKLGQDEALSILESEQVRADSVRPGMIFFIDTGKGKGHAGVVVDVHGDQISTIEGNTNNRGGREGFGVFLRKRKLKMANLMGYLDFWTGD